MDSRAYSAAGAAVERVHKLGVQRVGFTYCGILNLHPKVHSSEPSVNEQLRRAGDVVSPPTAAVLRDNARARTCLPTRRKQQQELLWGSLAVTRSPCAQQLIEPKLESLELAPQPPGQQEQEPSQAGRSKGAGAPNDTDISTSALHGPDGDGRLGPTDLLAQQDAVLLMRSGRHRNRRPLVSAPQPTQPQLPCADVALPATAEVEAAPTGAGPVRGPGQGGGDGGHPSGGTDAGEHGPAPTGIHQSPATRTAPGPPPLTAPGHSDLQPGDAGPTALAPVTNSGGEEPVVGGSDGGGAGGGESPRGHAVLRLRRHGSEAQATRRIRLLLPQRPKPWPVKLLLEAQQREHQQHGGEPGQAEGREQLQQLLGPAGEGSAEGWVGLTDGLPSWQAQERERAQGLRQEEQQLGQQQERRGPRGTAPGNEGARKRRGKQDQQGQGRGAVEQEQMQQQGSRTQRQQHIQQGQQQERQQKQEQERKLQTQASAVAAGDSAAGGRGARKVAADREVLAHPDGTLWSYRDRDVGPLAARVLRQLQQQQPYGQRPWTQQQQQPQVVRGNGGRTAVASTRKELGAAGSGGEADADDSNGSHSDSSSGSNVDGSNTTDGTSSDAGGGSCHVLAPGSYQAYNVLRALSYVQGALRLASYNRLSRGAEAAPPAPVLSFTATHVSLPDIRSYFLQTVRDAGGGRPELGPPPPPRPPRGQPQQPSPQPGACVDNPRAPEPHQGGRRGGAAAAAAARSGAAPAVSHAPPPPPAPYVAAAAGPPLHQPLEALKGWPTDESQLDPRALVSVFLTPPPGGLLTHATGSGGGTANASRSGAPGFEPPIAVTARADVGVLTRLLTARLRRNGATQMQALGREAASRALGVLSGASLELAASGLGAVAFPHMEALGPQRRAASPLTPPPPLLGKKATAAAGAAGAVQQPAAPLASDAAAAATAALGGALDPVLLDKAPQLVLQVVLCEWDEAGRPVVPERLSPGPPVAAAVTARPMRNGAAAPGPGTAQTARVPAVSPGAGREAASQPGAAAEARGTGIGGAAMRSVDGADSDAARHQSAASPTPGAGGGGAAGVAARPRVQLSIPLAGGGSAAGRCEVRLRQEGGADTRSAAAAVARGLADGRPVAVTAAGLGSLLRLPVVLFRAQGELRKVDWRQRRALLFTLRVAASDLRRGKGASGVEEKEQEGRAGAVPRRGQQQRRTPQPQPGSQPGWQAELSAAVRGPPSRAAPQPARAEAVGAEGTSLVAEVFWVPASALHSHLDALPWPPPEIIAARSSSRRLPPHLLHGDDEGEDADCDGIDEDDAEDVTGLRDDGGSGGDSGGGRNQRHVQKAAAAAVVQLLRYGTATLAGTSPGRRLTALLAAGGVSEGLWVSAGLTVLLRVDDRARPPPSHPAALQSPGRQAPAWRPHPPARYQMLLARVDPRTRRLQLLRPEDLASLKRATEGAGLHATSGAMQ